MTTLTRVASRVLLSLLLVSPVALLAPPANANTTITILSSSSYVDNIDYRHVVGEVRNDSTSNVSFVQLNVTFHDSSDRLLATETSYASLDILAPGEKSPFHAIHQEVPAYDHYKLSVSASATTQEPNHNFTTTVTNEFTDSIDYRHIVGTVRNDNTTTAEFVELIITLYDGSGTVVDTDFTYVKTDDRSRVQPGQTAPFEFALSQQRGWTSYSIVTESSTPPAGPGSGSPSAPPSGPASPGPTSSPSPAASPTPSSAELSPTVSIGPSTIGAGETTFATYRGTPGATLDILSRTQPATLFTKIGTVTLNSDGAGASSHRPQKNTRITARTAGGRLSDNAPIVAVRSVASFNANRVGARTYTFTGRVYPALSNRLVNIYRSGLLIAQARCDASGIYSVTRTLGAGTFTFLARTPNDQSNLGTTSPARVVSIR